MSIEEAATALVTTVSVLIDAAGRSIEAQGAIMPDAAREAITTDLASLVAATAQIVEAVAMLQQRRLP